MFVLGIDPGLARCGYGAVRGQKSTLVCEDVGVLTTTADETLPERLLSVFRGLQALIKKHSPDVVSVERLFFQTNVRTAMVVGQASGLALLAAAEAGIPVVQYTANEVKKVVAGWGAAPKEQVQKMVAVTLGLAEIPRPDDAADGLALAICHHSHARLGSLADAATGAGGNGYGSLRVATSFAGHALGTGQPPGQRSVTPPKVDR